MADDLRDQMRKDAEMLRSTNRNGETSLSRVEAFERLFRHLPDLIDELERLRKENRRHCETGEAMARGWRADAAELERLRAELRRWDGHEALTATLIKQAEAERDHYRERLAETDQGAVILALEETIAAADADRDRLEAERDALKAALEDAATCWPDPFGNWSAKEAHAGRAVKEHMLRKLLAALDTPTPTEGETRG